jgi:hypothetical protein
MNQRPAQMSLERRVNGTTNHINARESRSVRCVRIIFLLVAAPPR